MFNQGSLFRRPLHGDTRWLFTYPATTVTFTEN